MDLFNSTYSENVEGFEFEVENWPRWPVEVTLRGERENWNWYEKMDLDWWYYASENYGWVIYPILGSYWLVTYAAARLMRDRAPLRNLKPLIAAYHVFMSLISAALTWLIFSTFYDNFVGWDWYYRTLCLRMPITDRSAFILITGGLLRIAQTLDSLCLIALRKPVPFFQIYHHSVAAFISVQLFPFGEPSLVFLGLVNSFQHAITYPYFAAKVLKIRVPRFIPKIILGVEMLQMVGGLATGLYTIQVIRTGGYCIRHPWSIKLFNFAYSTLFILVAHTAYLHFTKSKHLKNKSL